MRRLLSSPRRRRRTFWVLGIALVVAVTAGVFFAFPNTSHIKKAESGPPEPIPQEEPEPTRVTLTPAARQAALKTAGDFIKTAVLGQNVDAAWELTTPALRQGMSRKEWAKGEIPVIPYPAKALRTAKWRVDHSYKDNLGIDVLFLPKSGRAGQGLQPLTFEIEMKAVGGPHRKHWLVDVWRPVSVSEPTFTPGSKQAIGTSRAPLSAVWLLVPVALILLLALVPIAFILRGWRAGRRANRAYRDYQKSATPPEIREA